MLSKGKQFLTRQTSVMVLIYIYIYRERVKYGKGLVDDRGKKQSTYKGKDPLSFEITVFHNGQLDHDDDHII
jgi:hypothetical protein